MLWPRPEPKLTPNVWSLYGPRFPGRRIPHVMALLARTLSAPPRAQGAAGVHSSEIEEQSRCLSARILSDNWGRLGRRNPRPGMRQNAPMPGHLINQPGMGATMGLKDWVAREASRVFFSVSSRGGVMNEWPRRENRRCEVRACVARRLTPIGWEQRGAFGSRSTAALRRRTVCSKRRARRGRAPVGAWPPNRRRS